MLRGFKKRPNPIIPSRDRVGLLLTEKAIIARAGLKDMVKGHKLNLTCGGWTTGGETPMTAVTAHWIDDKWTMKSVCLHAFELVSHWRQVRIVCCIPIERTTNLCITPAGMNERVTLFTSRDL